MFKRVLAPFDGTVQSEIAVRYALDFVTQFQASLTGLHVIDSKVLEAPYFADLSGMSGAVPFSGLMTQVREGLERHGRQVLKNFEEICAQRGIRPELVQETGDIAKVIAEQAKSHDLICMGRRSEKAEWVGHLLGSTVENTLRWIQAPVLLAGDLYRETRRLLIAYDGSRFANAALRVAIQFLETNRELQCSLVAVATHKEEAAPLLHDARQLLAAHEIEFSEMIRAGDPREQIVRSAEECNADLVVMGAFGHSRLHEILLGSTTEAIMRTCSLPVLVTRAG